MAAEQAEPADAAAGLYPLAGVAPFEGGGATTRSV